MLRLLRLDLWREERGSASPEWAFVATLLVLGAITGLVASRQRTLPAEPASSTALPKVGPASRAGPSAHPVPLGSRDLPGPAVRPAQ
jgi:hypothetical protein